MASGTIVVDGTFFTLNMVTGVARVWREVLKQWSQSEFGERIVILNRGHLPDECKAFTIRDCPPLDFDRWRDDPPIVQRLCDELDAAVFLSTYYTHPLRTPTVLWVHDMIPERMDFDLTEPMWQQKHAAIAYASAYACSSAFTLQDLIALIPEATAKPASVVGCGVTTSMRPAIPNELRLFHDSFVKPKLGGRRYIFVPGSIDGYKNGPFLAEALARMDCSNLALLLTWNSEAIKRFTEVPGLMTYCETLKDADMRLAYASAHCLVNPSFYEGFGIPLIEAMACGCPVICSGGTSLREVAGDAALLIDPRRPGDLVEALRYLDEPGVRQTLVTRGFERAKDFSWYSVVAELETLIFELISRHS